MRCRSKTARSTPHTASLLSSTLWRNGSLPDPRCYRPSWLAVKATFSFQFLFFRTLRQEMSNSAPPGGDDPSTTLTYSPKINPTSPPDLRLLHYNDVYHVDASSSEPVGGFSRFQTLCNHYRNGEEFRRNGPELLTFFSGDAFNPSLESSVTKGQCGTSCLLMR